MDRLLKPAGTRLIPAIVVLLALGCSSGGTSEPGVNESPGLGNESVGDVRVVASVDRGSPNDAVPSPDGSTVYFSTVGTSGVFRTTDDPAGRKPVEGGEVLTKIRGLSISTNGKTLFVADEGGPGGTIVSLPVKGGEPVLVAGTEGTDPAGVEVVNQQGTDVLYYTGRDRADGIPAIFKILAAGGERAVLFKGAPLVDPEGVAVSAEGVVYLADREAGSNRGAVFRLDADGPRRLYDQIDLGAPAGIALTMDGDLLLVSSKNTSTNTAQVLLLNVRTGESGVVDKEVGANHNAGGLHRAHDNNVFAWADVQRRVYRF